MRRPLLSLVLVLIPAFVQAGEKHKAPAYPDLSSPRAAALTLDLALVKGDEKTFKRAYIGEDPLPGAYLKAFARLNAAGDRFTKAMQARFGKKADDWLQEGDDFERLTIGPTGTQRVATDALIRSMTLKRDGETATLATKMVDQMGESRDVHVRLKRVGGEWKVTEYLPLPVPGAIGVYAQAAAMEKVAKELEQGRYENPEEVVRAIVAEAFSEWRRLVGEDESKKSK